MQTQFYSLRFDSVQTICYASPLHEPVSFILQPGEWVALRGPSGSGKTTLLRAALGFCEAYCGEIRINQETLNHRTAALLRGVAGYLPQRPYLGQGSVRAVSEDLLPDPEHQDRLRELLPRLGLGSKIWDSPAERLSGGELQRLGLAMLLSRQPKVLLLDEPSSGLDEHSLTQLLGLLREQEIAGLFSSHDSRLQRDLAHLTVEITPCKSQVQEAVR